MPPKTITTIEKFEGLKLGDGAARVSVTTGYSHDYGSIKCSVNISLACDQNEATIDRAADMALDKAAQLADIGMTQLLDEATRQTEGT